MCDHKGLGLSQQARFGESGSDPDRDTARQVLEPSIGTLLASYAAHELIKAIYVGAPDKSSGKRRQSIHICYDLIGFIPLSELMTQEWHDPKVMPFLKTIKLSYAPRPFRPGFL